MRTEPEIVDDGQSRLLLDGAPDAMVCVDSDGRIVLVNAQVERVFGYRPDELVGQLVEVLVPEGLREVHRGRRSDYVASPSPRPMGSGIQLAARKKDGDEIPVDISLSAVDLVAGRIVVTAIRDVSDRTRDEAALRTAELRFNAAFHHALIGMALIDNAGRVIIANDAIRAMFGLVVGADYETDLLTMVHPADRDTLRRALGDLSSGEVASYRCECRLVAGNGLLVWVALSVALASDVGATPTAFVLQFEDISERRRAVTLLEHQTLHDPLTGLPNRVLFADRVHQALARDARTGGITAVFYLDVDRFKNINDVFGHDVGDVVIRDLAVLLNGVLRPSDTLARLGGDEFAVVAADLPDPQEATAVAERLRVAASSPMMVAGTSMQLSVSIGIAFAQAGMGVSEILRASDLAMYVAKERGKDRFAVFDEALQVSASERLSMEQLLREALRDNRIAVHYQPLVHVGTRRLASVEALVRVTTDDSVILPARFIDIAEESGLIVEMGTHVLREACRQAAVWLNRLGPAAPPRIAVNLSPRQLLHAELVDSVGAALADSGLAADHLALEITETAFMEATGSVIETIEQLRELGVHLGVDDFGTGYASLTYLKLLPVDFVKIDASFVQQMADNTVDDAIVRSVVDLGHALGLTTIAEGVERTEELEALQSTSCDLAQGFLFSEALPSTRLESLLI